MTHDGCAYVYPVDVLAKKLLIIRLCLQSFVRCLPRFALRFGISPCVSFRYNTIHCGARGFQTYTQICIPIQQIILVIHLFYTDSTGCAYNIAPEDNSVLLIVAYVMAGLCVVFLMVPLVFLYVHWQMERIRLKKEPEAPEDDGLLEPHESDS